MKIDCDACSVRGPACRDCVVSFLTIPVRSRSIELDADEEAAVAALAAGGLVPPLRLVRGA